MLLYACIVHVRPTALSNGEYTVQLLLQLIPLEIESLVAATIVTYNDRSEELPARNTLAQFLPCTPTVEGSLNTGILKFETTQYKVP